MLSGGNRRQKTLMIKDWESILTEGGTLAEIYTPFTT